MAELDDLDEVRLLALDDLIVEKKIVFIIKKGQSKVFKKGELVWKVILPVGHKDHQLRK